MKIGLSLYNKQGSYKCLNLEIEEFEIRLVLVFNFSRSEIAQSILPKYLKAEEPLFIIAFLLFIVLEKSNIYPLLLNFHIFHELSLHFQARRSEPTNFV